MDEILDHLMEKHEREIERAVDLVVGFGLGGACIFLPTIDQPVAFFAAGLVVVAIILVLISNRGEIDDAD